MALGEQNKFDFNTVLTAMTIAAAMQAVAPTYIISPSFCVKNIIKINHFIAPVGRPNHFCMF